MVSAGYSSRIASTRLPASVSEVETTSSPSRLRKAVKKSFFSRMKGDMAARAISASISERAALSAPLMSSKVKRLGAAGDSDVTGRPPK